MRAGLQQLEPQHIQELEAFFNEKFPIERPFTGGEKLERFLDMLESLWTIQALKERHFDSWFRDLATLQMKEV